MRLKEWTLACVKRFGAATKFAAKLVLQNLIPGGAAVVELVEGAIDCVRETASDELEYQEQREPKVSPAELERVAAVLEVLTGDLGTLMQHVADLHDRPDLAQQLLERTLSVDKRCQDAARKLDWLSQGIERLEEQNRRLLEGQGYSVEMLEEMLPLLRRLDATGARDAPKPTRAASLRDTAAPTAARSPPTPSEPPLAVRVCEVKVTVPGTWRARPADDPRAAWEAIKSTPSLVAVDAGSVYQLHVDVKVTDEELVGLVHLRGLSALQSLDLEGCEQVTDEGLAHLRGFSALRELCLSRCEQVTCAGLAHLRGLSTLRKLDLRGCEGMRDDGLAYGGLAHLRALSALRELELRGCNWVTDWGLAQLRAALPKCKIR